MPADTRPTAIGIGVRWWPRQFPAGGGIVGSVGVWTVWARAGTRTRAAADVRRRAQIRADLSGMRRLPGRESGRNVIAGRRAIERMISREAHWWEYRWFLIRIECLAIETPDKLRVQKEFAYDQTLPKDATFRRVPVGMGHPEWDNLAGRRTLRCSRPVIWPGWTCRSSRRFTRIICRYSTSGAFDMGGKARRERRQISSLVQREHESGAGGSDSDFLSSRIHTHACDRGQVRRNR